ncbi:MAG: CapA family protein [bacterium]
MKRLNLVLIIILILDIVCAGYFWHLKLDNKPEANIQTTIQSEPEPEIIIKPEPPEITLMFVGDIMLSRGVGNKMLKESNYKWPFLKIADYLQEADLLFGNLEGPLSDKGVDTGKKYSFRADPKALDGLIYAGFDVLSIANNHIYDWGEQAMQDTILRLKNNNILPAGLGEKPILEIENTKISFSAYTWPLPEKIDLPEADIKIVSMHIGEEYQKKSNLEQQKFARMAIDAGADLVIGHHPHVTQEIEKYKDKFIFYSLGNFVFDQQFSQDVKNGWIAEIIIKNKKIIKAEPINIIITSQYQARLKPARFIDIDISEQKLSLYENSNLLKSFVISSGAPKTPTPKGDFSISEKIVLHWSEKYQQYLPYALRFDNFYLIHEVPYSKEGLRDGLDKLGQPASHGCIRLNINDAQEVYNWAEIGTEVFIHE